MTKTLFKKIFVMLALIFFIAIPAYVLARPADPSKFPKYEPLQPMPENIKPNYEGNISSQEETGLSDSEENAEEEESVNSQSTGNANEEGAETSNTAAPASGVSAWPLVIIFAVLAILVGIVFVRKDKK